MLNKSAVVRGLTRRRTANHQCSYLDFQLISATVAQKYQRMHHQRSFRSIQKEFTVVTWINLLRTEVFQGIPCHYVSKFPISIVNWMKRENILVITEGRRKLQAAVPGEEVKL